MSRELFELEKGILIAGENEDSGQSILRGSVAPGGDAAEQDDALQGSLFLRDNGALYIKKLAGTGTDRWTLLADADDLSGIKFRSEIVRSATGDVVVAGVRDLTASPFSDDETPLLTATDFTVGEFVIGGVGGTPTLFEVTDVSAPNITLVAATGGDALSDGDRFVVRAYLPDSDGTQENQALVEYDSSTPAINKIGDIDWNFATGINLSSGYTSQNGIITSSDSVESAIEKLDGNQIDLTTLSGESQGAVDHGTFPGTVIDDGSTTREALEDLEGAIDAITLGNQVSLTGVTSVTDLDTVLVDEVMACKWLVTARLASNPARVRSFEVYAQHNGNSAADATGADDTVYARLRNGAGFNVQISVDVSGAGAAQQFRLRISSSTPGIDVNAVRVDCVRF